jgi:hypothetical protein
VQFGRQKREIELTKVRLDTSVQDWLARPGADGQPQTARPPFAVWKQLGPGQRQSIDIILAQNARMQYEPARADKSPPGHVVVLPDGSRIADPNSPTGHVMSPVPDLSAVAAAGRRAGEGYRARLRNPETHLSAIPYLLMALGFSLGHAGAYDYQREGNLSSGYVQHPQFRAVSNINVGLFCQQAGLTEDETLSIAGSFAALFSKNARSDRPYGLEEDTATYTRIGFRLGKAGIFNPPSSP